MEERLFNCVPHHCCLFQNKILFCKNYFLMMNLEHKFFSFSYVSNQFVVVKMALHFDDPGDTLQGKNLFDG